jgi:hypothetical protein
MPAVYMRSLSTHTILHTLSGGHRVIRWGDRTGATSAGPSRLSSSQLHSQQIGSSVFSRGARSTATQCTRRSYSLQYSCGLSVEVGSNRMVSGCVAQYTQPTRTIDPQLSTLQLSVRAEAVCVLDSAGAWLRCLSYRGPSGIPGLSRYVRISHHTRPSSRIVTG